MKIQLSMPKTNSARGGSSATPAVRVAASPINVGPSTRVINR